MGTLLLCPQLTQQPADPKLGPTLPGTIMKTRLLIAALLLLALAAVAYWFLHRSPALQETDSVVILDIANSTGDAELDGSLREALRVALAQSPFLNILSDEKLRDALLALGRSTKEAITPPLAHRICERLAAKASITGTIAKSPEGYLVSLDAATCASDSAIAHAEVTAARKDQILHTLGLAAARLRKELGEAAASVEKFDYPLERAASASLPALRSYSDARKTSRETGDSEAIPLFKQSLELDPGFALAHSELAVCYYNNNQNALAAEEIRLAFENASRQSTRDHLHITTLYDDLGTGDVQKAIESYKEWARLYPRDDIALGNLSSEYFLLGDYEQAAANAHEALRLDPGSAAWYENYSTALISLMRLEEAQSVLNDAFARKLDDASMHSNLYDLGFLRGDRALMQQQLEWSTGKPGGEDSILAAQADTEAYAGHLQKAREFSQRAIASARKSNLNEPAAIWQGLAGLREAAFGNLVEARKAADKIMELAPSSRDAETIAALVYARSGDFAQAQPLVDDLRARYVSNTIVQSVWLPVIQAQMDLQRKKPDHALELLDPVTQFERGQLIGNLSSSCLLPAYLRGEARLANHRGTQAVSEFQKILESRGIVGNCWSAPLAHLGIARAQAINGNFTASHSAYQEFFTLWKDADADIPILKQAKAEYAKLPQK
jgi:tetratricopeptide (TPR) repeat protein